MQKNFLYLAIIIALGLIIYFFVIKDSNNSYGASDSDFSVKDTADIGKIFLADLKGNTILAERKKGYWQVNESFTARPEIINSLLTTFMQLQVDVPVAKSMYNNVVKDIAGDHIKVEIYNRKNKKIRSYYIGSPNNTYRGNFMLMEGSKVPFIVVIPGFQGFVSSRFFLEEKDWRDRTIFRYNPTTIAKIEVEYPRIPDSSFTIIRTVENNFTFETPVSKGTFNPELGNYYFNQFKVLNCEFFIEDTYKMDSLLKETPVCVMQVTNTEGTVNKVNIYYRPIGTRSRTQFTPDDLELQYDLDKFYAIFNNQQSLAMIQNFVFGKLFVGPHFFYRTRPTGENLLQKPVTEKASGASD